MISLGPNSRIQYIFLFWLHVNMLTHVYSDFKGNIADTRLNSRIVGGMFAEEGQFPFQVSVQSRVNQHHICNGIIVGERWVLTVKSCSGGAPPNAITILAGTNNFSEPQTIISRQSNNIINHADGDIVLVQVEEGFVFNDLIKNATLPEEEADLSVGTMASAAGWGLSWNANVNQHTELQFIRQRIMSRTVCEQYTGFKETDGYFCTISTYRRGLCDLDEGASLVADDGVVVGIATADRISCGDGYPEVFKKLSMYVSWIKTITEAGEES